MEKLLNGPMKLNLQLFADEGNNNTNPSNNNNSSTIPPTGDSSNQNNGDKNDDNNNNSNSNSSRTFTREDVRKMLSAETNKAIEKFKNESLPSLLDEASKKGEERAKMTESQRRKADEDARIKELEAREQALNQREALTSTKDLLSKNELPLDFADMLTDLDENKRLDNVLNFKKAFNAAVQAGVENRLKGQHNPQAGSNGNNSSNNLGTQFAQIANQQATKPVNDPWANLIK